MGCEAIARKWDGEARGVWDGEAGTGCMGWGGRHGVFSSLEISWPSIRRGLRSPILWEWGGVLSYGIQQTYGVWMDTMSSPTGTASLEQRVIRHIGRWDLARGHSALQSLTTGRCHSQSPPGVREVSKPNLRNLQGNKTSNGNAPSGVS